MMLGKSEMMITHRELFAPAELKHRIFVKQSRPSIASRASSFGAGEAGRQPNGDDERTARDAALELGAAGPRDRLAQRPADVRQPAGARAVPGSRARISAARWASCRWPSSPVALLAPVEQALRERRRVAVGEVTFTPDRGDPRRLEVSVDAAALDRQRRDRARASSSRTSRATQRSRPSSRATGATSSSPTRSCSRRSTSSRRPTRSCSPPTRSCRRPTRSSSRPTRSSRR